MLTCHKGKAVAFAKCDAVFNNYCPTDELRIVSWISVFIIQVTEKYSTAMC